MGRKKLKPETIKNRIKKDIESKLIANGTTTEIYMSKLQEYMDLYEHRRKLQETAEEMSEISDGKELRAYMECTKEIRQLEKAMRDTLNWLGISPTLEPPKEEDYDL